MADLREDASSFKESMWYECVRDSAFGQIVRLVTKKKVFKFIDEKNPDIWKQLVNEEKSGYMAHHGTTDPPDEKEDNESLAGLGGIRSREEKEDGGASLDRPEWNGDSSSDTQVDRTQSQGEAHRTQSRYNQASGVKIDPEKGRDVHLIEYFPNDPENPLNWSFGKKAFVTGLICLLTTGIYIGSAIFTAGIEDFMVQFGVAQVPATLGLCLFVAGYGLGPMLWSPMSEIPQIGRNPIYIGTLFVFVFLQFAVIYATNFGMFLAFRFLTGFFGSPVLATGGATLSDMYAPKQRAYAMSIWGVAAVCGPTMGPLVGGFAAQAKGWTWTIWELLWLSGFALIVLFFFLPETSSNNIIYRRAKRLRKSTGNSQIKSQPELVEMTGKDIVMMALVRPITLNFMEPMVFMLNLYIALIYGLLYIWFESFPIVFVGIYGFNLGEQGLAFLGILIGALVVIPPFFLYLKKYIEPRVNEDGSIRPEDRLPAACVGAFCIPICLFWFGWASRPGVHWIVPIIGSSFFSIGAFLLFNSVLNYLPDAYPDNAASVLAGNDLFRSSFGAGFPLFAGAMYKRLGVGWASSLLAFLSVAFIPIPFILFKYGETLRKNHSKFARKDI